MQYYTVSDLPSKSNILNDSTTFDTLLNWKLVNIRTYMSKIVLNDESSIRFSIDIDKVLYNFEIKNINESWTVFFSDIITTTKIITKILNMVDLINDNFIESNEYILNDLYKLLDIIENTIDNFDIKDSDSETESDGSMHSLNTCTTKKDQISFDPFDDDDDDIICLPNGNIFNQEQIGFDPFKDEKDEKDDKDLIKYLTDTPNITHDTNDIIGQCIKTNITHDTNDIIGQCIKTNIYTTEYEPIIEDNEHDLDQNEKDDQDENEENKIEQDGENEEKEHNMEQDEDYESDDDFKRFIKRINTQDVKPRYNYDLLKSNAYELIEKNQQNVDNIDTTQLFKLFKPEESVRIIINEIKQFDKYINCRLDINKNIYNFNVEYMGTLSEPIHMNIKLDMLKYPYIAPIVTIIKPIMTMDFNMLITNMDYFKHENWNPTNSISVMVQEIGKLIDIHGVILENQAELYTDYELSNLLTKLSQTTKINPSNLTKDGNIMSFQIPFIKGKCNDEICNNSTKSSKSTKSSHYSKLKSGTGYGDYGSHKWDIKKYLDSDKYKLEELINVIQMIAEHLIEMEKQTKLDIKTIINSCLLEFVVQTLTDNCDIVTFENNQSYMDSLITIINIIATHNIESFKPYFEKFRSVIEVLTITKNIRSKTISDINDKAKTNSPNIIDRLIENAQNIIEEIQNSINSTNINNVSDVENPTNLKDTEKLRDLYIQTLKPYQFGMCNNLPNICKITEKIKSGQRLSRDLAILSKSLPIDYESAIFVRIDETNIQSMNVLIIPSHDTPYSNGCFLFNIRIDSMYPKKPPNVLLVTTGNGTVRFNPNLYSCGKVCLSLLGTWSGDQSEQWNESSTLLQVLISIQSLIFIDQPYFNEPGYQSSFGTSDGMKRSENYNKNIQHNTIKWAMIDMLQHPPFGFEEIIHNHFKLKKDHIMAETHKWATTETHKLTTTSKLPEILLQYNKLSELLSKL